MRRTVRTNLGVMLVNDLDVYLGRSLVEYGEFSRGEQDLFCRVIRRGQVVVDAGANIGAHTLLFAQLVGRQGRVYAYEPQRLLFQMLCANMALNRIDNVHARPVALGREAGEVYLKELNPDCPQSFGSASIDGLLGGGERTAVEPLTEPCDFLKVDVEGMECEVLAGAQAMLRQRRPLLYIENDRADRSAELLALIRSLGYVPRWHVTPLFSPVNFNQNPHDVWDANYLSFNLACAPAGSEVFADLQEAHGSHLDWLAEQREQVAA
jgi:FkbM family methyltransferase